MSENCTSALFSDDQPACDLVIDTFDQMRNPADFSLSATGLSFCWAVPVDSVESTF